MNAYLEQQFGLSGKRALVTGAGRGIGRAIAEALAGAGAEVCLHYNTSQGPSEQCADAIRASGGSAWCARADLTRPDEASRLIEAVAGRWGGLDILVNNTGDLVRRAPVADYPDDLLETVMRVNIHSAIYCTRASLPLLREGTDPCVINLSSVAAHNGGGGGAVVYAATKGAIHTLTRGLAKELAPDVRVNGIAPGVIMTDFHRKHSSKEVLERIEEQTPLKRLGQAEECAGAAVFLCSAAASFITGEIIEVNGGLWVA